MRRLLAPSASVANDRLVSSAWRSAGPSTNAPCAYRYATIHLREISQLSTMRVLLAFALSYAALVPPAFAGACSGAEHHLAAARQAIAQKDADQADRILSPLRASHPGCPELLLSLARVRGAKGEIAEANNLFRGY